MTQKEAFNFGTILIIIIFTATLINHSISFSKYIPQLINSDTWNQYSNKESPEYSKLGALTLFIEFGGNTMILILNLIVIVSIIIRHNSVRKLIMTYFILTLAYIVIDIYLTRLVTEDNRINSNHLDWFGKTLLIGLFITIYIYNSKRFKTIFNLN
jgi:hypothetical protein